jgi:hypothetical protein
VLAGDLGRGRRLPEALRDLADRLADPIADLVVAALLLAAQGSARELSGLLGSLAGAAREQAAGRLRVAAARARLVASVRIITAIIALTAVLLVVFSRPYLAPYAAPAGQVVLCAVAGLFTAALAMMARMARWHTPARFLTGRTDRQDLTGSPARSEAPR